MNVTLRRTMMACVLALIVAAPAAGAVSAEAKSLVVGPGESIQKAINAADPGDTIVVRGVHHEDVAIRKNGIKLRGDDAVIEPPAKADSPCAPEAICILGGMNFQTGEITGPRVSDVSVSGFTIRDFPETSLSIDVILARNATVAGNRIVGNAAGIGVTVRSINTTIVNNDVLGNPNSGDSGIAVEEHSSHTTIAKNVVRSFPEGQFAIEVAHGAIDTTIAGNDLVGNKGSGVLVVDSPGTKILSNDISRSGIAGTIMVGQKSANAKVVGNNISGGGFGMWVVDTKRGSFTGNTIRDNCAGMFFEAFPSQPVGDFEVKANTVEDNTRSCRAAQFDRNFSGIGIALLGARDLEVAANHLSGNVPSGPTAVSGGVVVATDPFFGGTIKPNTNTVSANRFGRNKPDIYWDKSGSGNRFTANLCDTSVPSRLCN